MIATTQYDDGKQHSNITCHDCGHSFDKETFFINGVKPVLNIYKW